MELRVENLTKKYKGAAQRTLTDINFKVSSGEIVGLVGSNGAGKTTLLKCLTKRLKYTEGAVLINNEEIWTAEHMLNDIGILMDPVFFDYLTAYENIKFYLNLNFRRDLFGKIDEILKFVGLYEKRNSSPRTFSFGMRQRLGLAMSIVTEPQILIMDEPFIGLDQRGIQDLVNIVKKWMQERSILVIISSHQLSELEELCTRYLLLDEGKIKDIDSKELHPRVIIKIANASIKLGEKYDIRHVGNGDEIVINCQGERLAQAMREISNMSEILDIRTESLLKTKFIVNE